MPDPFITESVAVLSRTPNTLNAFLRELPDAWTEATDGPGTWSPRVVIGHLVHAEQTDWMPRLRMILEHGPSRPFEPFDREAQLTATHQPSLASLLDEFIVLRNANLANLEALHLAGEHLALQGTHPAFGPVTLRQLLATWTAHDLAHILQISRTMARRYREETGPWAEYLSVMK